MILGTVCVVVALLSSASVHRSKEKLLPGSTASAVASFSPTTENEYLDLDESRTENNVISDDWGGSSIIVGQTIQVGYSAMFTPASPMSAMTIGSVHFWFLMPDPSTINSSYSPIRVMGLPEIDILATNTASGATGNFFHSAESSAKVMGENEASGSCEGEHGEYADNKFGISTIQRQFVPITLMVDGVPTELDVAAYKVTVFGKAWLQSSDG
nr:hypothetical protein [Armatimonas sp.]